MCCKKQDVHYLRREIRSKYCQQWKYWKIMKLYEPGRITPNFNSFFDTYDQNLGKFGNSLTLLIVFLVGTLQNNTNNTKWHPYFYEFMKKKTFCACACFLGRMWNFNIFLWDCNQLFRHEIRNTDRIKMSQIFVIK